MRPTIKNNSALYMIVAIKRAKRFSPNSEDKDARILECLCDLLKRSGFDVSVVDEDGFRLQNDVDAYISMARSEEALKELRKSNVPVINAPQAVLYGCQNRMLQYAFLRQRGFQVPGDKGSDGYWIKKNNGYSECEQDVVFAQDAKSRDKAVTIMKLRGIANPCVCAHVKGDLVKFYGVSDTQFFRYYYPDDDGEMKFSNNGHNGVPKHTPFDEYDFMYEANAVANALELDFYGGDCIVTEDGERVYIDINDWPSYSRCYMDAAQNMAVKVIQKLHHGGLDELRDKIESGYFEGIIFDYGGTLDSDGMHWGKRIWHAYQKNKVPVDEALFRDAYVHAERTLAKNPLIKPEHDFSDTLSIKLDIELEYIQQHIEGFDPDKWHDNILDTLILDTEESTSLSHDVLRDLFGDYVKKGKTVLVSNFYGNVSSVLKQFNLDGYFSHIIESAVVGVRKPDPEIYRLGLKALGAKDPSRVLVIGDSYDKDIIPAREIGCKTLWYMGEGWTPDIPRGEKADWAMTTWFDVWEGINEENLLI